MFYFCYCCCFSSLLPNVLFQSQDPIQATILHLLVKSWLWLFLRLSLFLMTRDSIKDRCSDMHRMPFGLVLSGVFSNIIRLGLWVLGRKTIKGKASSHGIIARVPWPWLDHLASSSVCQVSQLWSCSPYFACCILWKEVTMYNPHERVGIILHFFERGRVPLSIICNDP